jgi:hypothetical protein
MKIIEKVSFEEVLKQFRAEHDADHPHEVNTNADAEESLQRAQILFGEWHRVSLTREDILQVRLPWHLSCGGDMELVPKTGLSVQETVEKLSNVKIQFKDSCPVCFNKLQRMQYLPFTPLFLSTQALDTEDYNELTIKSGLIHLDGLHRMIGWELHGLFINNPLIEAYLASNPNITT